jgi:hypothetical protein
MSYEEKYLKYKNKYLALKKQILALQNSQDQPVVERSGPSGIFNNFSLNNIFGGGEDKTETETTLPGMNSDVPEEINGGARARGGRKSSSRKGRKTSSRKHSRNFLTSSSSSNSSSSSKSDSDSDFDSSELEWH